MGGGGEPSSRKRTSGSAHQLNQLNSKIATNEAAIDQRRQELEQIDQAKMRASQSNNLAAA